MSFFCCGTSGLAFTKAARLHGIEPRRKGIRSRRRRRSASRTIHHDSQISAGWFRVGHWPRGPGALRRMLHLLMAPAAAIRPPPALRAALPPALRAAAQMSAGNGDLDMDVLARRIAGLDASSSQTQLCSLMVWPEALLPRQRLSIRVGPPFTELLENERDTGNTVVLVGSNLRRTTLLSHGVSVNVERYVPRPDGYADVDLLGLRRCELIELQEDHSLQEWTGNRWFAALVRWADWSCPQVGSIGSSETAEASKGKTTVEPELAHQGELVRTLVGQWEALVREGRERVPAAARPRPRPHRGVGEDAAGEGGVHVPLAGHRAGFGQGARGPEASARSVTDRREGPPAGRTYAWSWCEQDSELSWWSRSRM